jgi:hypothetical protein
MLHFCMFCCLLNIQYNWVWMERKTLLKWQSAVHMLIVPGECMPIFMYAHENLRNVIQWRIVFVPYPENLESWTCRHWQTLGIPPLVSCTCLHHYNLCTDDTHFTCDVKSPVPETSIHGLMTIYTKQCTVTSNIIFCKVWYGILKTELLALLENFTLCAWLQMYFQHDGIPPNFSRNVTQNLNEQFPDWWISCGGVQNWPPWSPDLSLLDYHGGGDHMKSMVYKRRVDTEVQLLKHIYNAARCINNFEVFCMVTSCLVKCVRICIQADSSHFEQLLTSKFI